MIKTTTPSNFYFFNLIFYDPMYTLDEQYLIMNLFMSHPVVISIPETTSTVSEEAPGKMVHKATSTYCVIVYHDRTYSIKLIFTCV